MTSRPNPPPALRLCNGQDELLLGCSERRRGRVGDSSAWSASTRQARPRPGSGEVVRCRGAPFLLARAIRGGQRWPVRVVLRGGWGGLYLLRGQPGWGGDQQRRGGERLRCPLCVARLVAACFTPVGDRQLPDGPSASHTHPSGSAAGSAPPPSSVGEAAGSPGGVVTCEPLRQPLRQP